MLNELGYSVEKYDESPGIYYENKGQASLFNTEGKTIVYINLGKLSTQSRKLEQYIRHVEKLCQEIEMRNLTDCNHFKDTAREKLNQIRKTEEILLEVTENSHRGTRRKRGLFNFIGEVSKVLFGTMDDDDAKYYNEQIKHFEENSNDITGLLKQQLYVVKSSLGSINDTLTDMEYNEEKMKTGLMQLKQYIEAATADSKNKFDFFSAKITVESHVVRINEAAGILQRNLDILVDSILNARSGILQPQIVSPNQIMSALIQSISSFPKDTTTPFPLSRSSINLMYKICDVHVYINEGILGYVISLPLINRGTFKIYEMIPIPITLGSNRFVYINTDESILCLDQTRQYYFKMKAEELNACKQLNARSYICKQKHPLLSSHLQESCEVKLLQRRRDVPKSCDTRLVQIRDTIWTQLDNNEWIYFAPSTESVTIICTGKEPIEVTLTGIGKLSINTGCKGYGNSASLQTSFTVKVNSSMKGDDVLSQTPLNFDCCAELGVKFNLSSLPVNFEFKHIASHLEDLKHASFKISELEKEVKEQEWKNRHMSKQTAYSAITYGLLGIILIYALYKLYRYVRSHYRPGRTLRALTAPPGGVQVPTETSGTNNIVNISIKTSNESLASDAEAIPLRTLPHSSPEESKSRRSLRPRVTKSYF
jgi:hypothetical protein